MTLENLYFVTDSFVYNHEKSVYSFANYFKIKFF